MEDHDTSISTDGGGSAIKSEDEAADPFARPIDRATMPRFLIDSIYDQHTCRILQQILTDERLSLHWLPVLSDMAKRIANTITLSQHSYLASIDSYYQSYGECSSITNGAGGEGDTY